MKKKNKTEVSKKTITCKPNLKKKKNIQLLIKLITK